MKTFEELKNQYRFEYKGHEGECSFQDFVDAKADNEPDFFRWFFDDDTIEDFAKPYNMSDERYNLWNDFLTYIDDLDTYDVCYDDDNNSNSEGFHLSFKECMDYIKAYNGTNDGYFKDYKGGTVSIFCHETGEDVYHEEIR